MMEILIPMFLALLVLMFFSVRKQKKMVAAQTELQDGLSPGDRVMTTSGLYATVADASDDTTIDLEIAEGYVTTWLRQAIREKVGPEVEDDELNDEDVDLDEHEADLTDTDEQADADEKDSEKAGPQVAPPLEHGTK